MRACHLNHETLLLAAVRVRGQLRLPDTRNGRSARGGPTCGFPHARWVATPGTSGVALILPLSKSRFPTCLTSCVRKRERESRNVDACWASPSQLAMDCRAWTNGISPCAYPVSNRVSRRRKFTMLRRLSRFEPFGYTT